MTAASYTPNPSLVTNSNTKSSSSTKSSSTSTQIAGNFDQFLQLLTTQLKSQSPLEPLDTNQFTQQLVQFAGVEQQLKTNDFLSALVSSNKNSAITNALGFVGATIKADGTKSVLQNGSATWNLTAPSAGSSTITIQDSQGNEVYSMKKNLTSGDQSFNWNGIKSDGQKAADATYTIVVAATNTSGATMNVIPQLSGIVDSVDISGTDPVLQVGSMDIPLTSVKSISR